MSLVELVTLVSKPGQLATSSHFLGLLLNLINAAHIHEGAFREVIPLAFAKLLEAANGFFDRSDLTSLACEGLSHDEGLTQETLNTPCASNNLFVFLRKLVHTQDGDNVLEFTVTLKNSLDVARNTIMFSTNDGWV